jgi:hypothetical protein
MNTQISTSPHKVPLILIGWLLLIGGIVYTFFNVIAVSHYLSAYTGFGYFLAYVICAFLSGILAIVAGLGVRHASRKAIPQIWILFLLFVLTYIFLYLSAGGFALFFPWGSTIAKLVVALFAAIYVQVAIKKMNSTALV